MAQFPETLKTWRRVRRLSQLELAGEADVSARHISFLETGRAQPSRDMIARLGEALNLPLASRNQMLGHAGFAPLYPARRWDDEEMGSVRAAVDHTLTAHAPYPGFAVDRLWHILQMNAPAKSLFGGLGIDEGDSLIDLVMADGLSDFVENWPEVAHHTAQRLQTESAAQGGVVELDRAADKLAAVPTPHNLSPRPVIPTIYKAGDLRLSLFSTIAQFGTPEDLTLDDLKIELFFPADTETERILKALWAGH